MFGEGRNTHTTMVSEDDKDRIESANDWAEENIEFIQIRPYAETRGVNAGPVLLKDLHSKPLMGTKSVRVPTMSFSMIYQNDTVRYVMGIRNSRGSSAGVDHLISPITTRYPESEVTRTNARDAFTPMEIGDNVMCGRVSMSNHCCMPTATRGSLTDPIEGDTHAEMIPKMVGDHPTDRSMMQVVFRPVATSWFSSGMSWGGFGDGRIKTEYRKKGEAISSGPNKYHTHEDPGSHGAAKEIENQRNELAFQAEISILSVSEDPDSAVERFDEMSNMFSEIDNARNHQEIVTRRLGGASLYDEVDRMIRRIIQPQRWLNRRIYGPSRVYTYRQLADGWVHFPTREGKIEDTVPGTYIDYSEMESGGGTPASSPSPADELLTSE